MGDWADSAMSSFFRSYGRGKAKRPATIVTCRYCGKRDLRWGKKAGGFWQVKHKDGSAHECAEMIQDRLGRPED